MNRYKIYLKLRLIRKKNRGVITYFEMGKLLFEAGSKNCFLFIMMILNELGYVGKIFVYVILK